MCPCMHVYYFVCLYFFCQAIQTKAFDSVIKHSVTLLLLFYSWHCNGQHNKCWKNSSELKGKQNELEKHMAQALRSTLWVNQMGCKKTLHGYQIRPLCHFSPP